MQTNHQHSPEDERASREAALDETIEATFPASDPMSTIPNPADYTALDRKHAHVVIVWLCFHFWFRPCSRWL